MIRLYTLYTTDQQESPSHVLLLTQDNSSMEGQTLYYNYSSDKPNGRVLGIRSYDDGILIFLIDPIEPIDPIDNDFLEHNPYYYRPYARYRNSASNSYSDSGHGPGPGPGRHHRY